MKKNIYILALILSLSISAQSFPKILGLKNIENPPTINLAQALKLALENNPELKKAQNSYQSAKADLNLAIAPLLPSLSAHAASHDSFLNQSPGDELRATLRAKIPLWDFKSFGQMKSKKLALSAAEAQYEKENNDFLFKVASAYIDAAVLEAQVIVAKEELERYSGQLISIKNKLGVGAAKLLDLINAEYLYNKSAADLSLKQNEKNRKLAELGALLFRHENFILDDIFIASSVFDETPQSLLNMVKNQWELIKIEKEIEEKNELIGAERLDFFPKLWAGVEGGYTLQKFPPLAESQNAGRPFAQIMVSLDLPFFTGGSSLATMKKHSLAKSSLEASKMNIILQNELNIYGLLNQIKAQTEAKDRTEQALIAAKKAADSAERLFISGDITATDLIDANTQFIAASGQKLKSELDLQKTQISLLYLVGKMSELL